MRLSGLKGGDDSEEVIVDGEGSIREWGEGVTTGVGGGEGEVVDKGVKKRKTKKEKKDKDDKDKGEKDKEKIEEGKEERSQVSFASPTSRLHNHPLIFSCS